MQKMAAYSSNIDGICNNMHSLRIGEASDILFYKYALIDIYCQKHVEDIDKELVGFNQNTYFSIAAILECENYICNYFKTENLGLYQLFDKTILNNNNIPNSTLFKCTIELPTNGSGSFVPNIKVDIPENVLGTCYFHDFHGDHRFLKLSIPKEYNKETYKEFHLKLTNIKFSNRNYIMICKGKKEKGKLTLYYYHGNPKRLLTSFARFYHKGRIIDQPISKINERIRLGFSTAIGWEACIDNIANIKVLPDIINDTTTSNNNNTTCTSTIITIMTDGCGYISESLVKKYHNNILIKDRLNEKYLIKVDNNKQSYPNVIQMRLAHKAGLFKGCLIVTNDRQLCNEDCIVMRKSMLKVEGSTHLADKSKCTLYVNSTFESNYHNNDYDDSCYSGSFSVYITLLLVALGLPKDIVMKYLNDTIEDIIDRDILCNNKCIYDFNLKKYMGSRDIDHHHDTSDDDDQNLTNEYNNQTNSNQTNNILWFNDYRWNEKINAILDCGHNREHPLIQYYLNESILSKIRLIRTNQYKFKFKMPQSVNIVGVPDLYNELEENEVFIYLAFKDTMDRDTPYLHGIEVLVSRYPMQHPGDIRKLKAATNRKLEEHVRGTSNSVIIFSTKGLRSQADKMGGGDYDGDLYLVIYNQDIVQNITEVEPYNANDYKSYETSSLSSSTSSSQTSSTSLSSSSCVSPTTPSSPISKMSSTVYNPPQPNNISSPPPNIRSISSPNSSCMTSPEMFSSPGSEFDCLICTLLFDNAFTKSLNDELGLYSLLWLCLADNDCKNKETLLLGHICKSAVDANKNVSMFSFPSTLYYLNEHKILKPDYMKNIFPKLDMYKSNSINSNILKHIDVVINRKDFINYLPFKIDEDLLKVVVEINGKAMIIWNLLDYIDISNKSKINPVTRQMINNNYNYQKSIDIITFLNENIILTKSEQWYLHLKAYKITLVNPKPIGYTNQQLKLEYYHLFQKDSRELYNACSNALNHWDINIFQRILASIIYHKTFYSCQELIPKQMSFIEICLNELLQNKTCILKMKMNRSLNDPRTLYNPKS